MSLYAEYVACALVGAGGRRRRNYGGEDNWVFDVVYLFKLLVFGGTLMGNGEVVDWSFDVNCERKLCLMYQQLGTFISDCALGWVCENYLLTLTTK